ncbi:MAG TPA: NlpC/P60 family protein [Acidobacteriota bacterium]|nr:NlpC/P60 family protein [Acidobacteriota bacterium]
MNRTVLIVFMSAMLSLPVGLSAAADGPGAAAPGAAVVISSVANMHSASNDKVELVSQAVLGTNVKILSSEKNAAGEEWFRIETPDTYPGWMIGTSLLLRPEGGKPYASEGPVFEVTSLFANIYATDDVTQRKPLIVAPIGSRLAVGACGERWCEITLPGGMKGWVQKGDGEIKDAAAARNKLTPDETVALAKRFLGVPYLWGGTSPLGIDCSGYAQLLYHLSGIAILRDADIQMTKSGLVEVPRGQERTRDLIFFGRALDKISHVGMMIGPDEFIHATTHDKPMVQISNLRDPYWQGLYQAARREKE